MLSRSRLTASEAMTILFTESEAGVASEDEDNLEFDHDYQSDDSDIEEPLNIENDNSEVNRLLGMFGLNDGYYLIF